MSCKEAGGHVTIMLADTCTDALEMFAGEQIEPGKGCLLQIYPATSNSEMIRLTESRITIGRDPECGVHIDDHAMSRKHAVIELAEFGYLLTDLNSTNGTFVDDEPLHGRIPLEGGELIRLGGTILKFMSAIDEEANYHAVVHDLMTRDSLTNAFNRSYLIPMIEKDLVRCREHQQHFSVVIMDIDHFKKINDQHGHLVGDEVLRIFCERVRHVLRQCDMLARFGGEEFVVACRETNLRDAGHIAERIRLAISSETFPTQAGRVAVTCSMGVASSNGTDFRTCDQLLSAADERLYAAKNAGRNQVQTFDPKATRFSR